MRTYDDDGPGLLGYLVRLLAVVVLLGGLGLGAFTLFGDISRPAAPRSFSVDLPSG